MSETPASGAGAGTAAALDVPTLSLKSLLEAGVHFGHQTRRWNPRMREFIYGERQGIHILNLDMTLELFQESLEFLRDTTAAGGKVLFVGTKRQAAPSIETEARRGGQFWVNNRWLGGMLTNFRTVKKSVERFKDLKGILENEEKAAEFSKRDRAQMTREYEKLRRSLEGIQEMSRLPDALFVIDVGLEHIAITEARRLGIPIVAVVDSNCDPDGVDFVVPGNDDALRAIQLYCRFVADACLEGGQLHQERLQSDEKAAPVEAQREGGVPSSGRVVVEIKQPPRRGRGGTHSAGGPRRGPRGGGEVEAPPEPPAESSE
ncbi:MAG TPA: 30S ribosomal protein S2 [Myxococcota bacterium]|jgi:small subunit ribosomal protein S2|nr:30S ribosomal protein S2 [Myxococcota bacterium]